VERLLVERGRFEGVESEGQRIPAGAVGIAAGAWSAALLQPLGVNLRVEPQRGQIIHLELPGTETGSWPILSLLADYYLVAWPGGRVAVGATRETGSGFSARPTVAGVRELLQRAAAIAPALGEASFHEVRVGLRPLSGDDLPYMGAVPGIHGVFVCTGHGASGLTLGPLSGRLIADQMLGREVSLDRAFAVAR
jgi:D-amino-acid dehydrogenase